MIQRWLQVGTTKLKNFAVAGINGRATAIAIAPKDNQIIIEAGLPAFSMGKIDLMEMRSKISDKTAAINKLVCKTPGADL